METTTSMTSTKTRNSIPWMEKYRPTHMDNIVLDDINKKILNNIIETSYFPNLLFYGPPGTGKTTTIINLINSYQQKLGLSGKGMMIHLNASDERGIDTIRNQINSFVQCKPIFNSGMKFVVLDEVDYMTKNAQQALIYLLQLNHDNVRFCLICNYISRIDEGLQNEFIKLHFNQLPEKDIHNFLSLIAEKENLIMNDLYISSLQKIYKSDIRSMINFMQSNQHDPSPPINDTIWLALTDKIKSKKSLKHISTYIHTLSIDYNIDKKNIIKDYLNWIIRKELFINNDELIKFLKISENILHFQECKNNNYVNYVIVNLFELF